MSIFERGDSDTQFLYLTGRDVVDLCTNDMTLSAVDEALRLHALGRTILPSESYLAWQTPAGAQARCLAMPGAVDSRMGLAIGLKTINASLGNTSAGRARSDGFTILLDPESARPLAVMQAAHISAQRTAAVSAIGARLLAPRAHVLAIVGCGTLGAAHGTLLSHAIPGIETVLLFDSQPGKMELLAGHLAGELPGRCQVRTTETAQACVRQADVVIFATTTTEGYVPYEWISHGAFVSHVSLDDLLPEVFELCDYLVVDDWQLVSGDERRILGKLAGSGRITGPADRHQACGGSPAATASRAVNATLGQLLIGQCSLPVRGGETSVCNPFGMAILDVALASAVFAAAQEAGRGLVLDL